MCVRTIEKYSELSRQRQGFWRLCCFRKTFISRATTATRCGTSSVTPRQLTSRTESKGGRIRRTARRSTCATGLLSKNAWSTLDNYHNLPVDDLLTKEGNYNDPYYYQGAANDPNKKQLFTCSLCGKSYAWMYSLRRHLLQCGNKEATNECQFCERKFYRRDRLKEHLLAHHSDLL